VAFQDSGVNTPRAVCETHSQSYTVGIGGGNGFLGTSGHRQIIGALCAERHTFTFANGTLCSACRELICSRAFHFIFRKHPQIYPFLQILRENWPMPLPFLNHSALVLFVKRTRIPISFRSIGFCAILVCVSTSSYLSG